MFLNPAMSAALDRIVERAADVRRAFSPGDIPTHDDVATAAPASDFSLDPLSVAPPKDLYFVTSDARGRVAYTRNGCFTLQDGTLSSAQGRSILGMRVPGAPLGELRVDPVDELLGRVENPRVEADGSLVYQRNAIDPRTGARASQRVLVGRIAVARFPAGTRLARSGEDDLVCPPGVAVKIGVPGVGEDSTLRPMRRERSRVDLDASLVRLKDAYLSFDALQAAETAKGRLGKTAMDLLK
ncbi:MAG: hypothetical protein WA814_06555 [Candidatus Baltobacteraceae bacterium]